MEPTSNNSKCSEQIWDKNFHVGDRLARNRKVLKTTIEVHFFRNISQIKLNFILIFQFCTAKKSGR